MATIRNDVKKLEKRLQDHFEDMLKAEIRWNYAFGKTYRKNKQIITGNPRNTVDTKETLKKIRVEITGTVNLKISVKFLSDSAQYIFGEEGHRSDYMEHALKKLPEYIAGIIVEYGLELRLGSKSKQSIRTFRKAKVKRKKK